MVDANKTPVQVGDRVIFIANLHYNAFLDTGTITKIYANDQECTVDRTSHIKASRLWKLDANGKPVPEAK